MIAPEMPSRTRVTTTQTIVIVPVQKAFSLFTRRSNNRPIHGLRLRAGPSDTLVAGCGQWESETWQSMTGSQPEETQRDLRLPIVAELDAAGFEDAEVIGRGGFGVVYK